MENIMETTGIIGVISRDYRVYIGVIYCGGTPVMENQMENKFENDMETGIIIGYIRVILGLDIGITKWKLQGL